MTYSVPYSLCRCLEKYNAKIKEQRKRKKKNISKCHNGNSTLEDYCFCSVSLTEQMKISRVNWFYQSTYIAAGNTIGNTHLQRWSANKYATELRLQIKLQLFPEISSLYNICCWESKFHGLLIERTVISLDINLSDINGFFGWLKCNFLVVKVSIFFLFSS